VEFEDVPHAKLARDTLDKSSDSLGQARVAFVDDLTLKRLQSRHVCVFGAACLKELTMVRAVTRVTDEKGRSPCPASSHRYGLLSVVWCGALMVWVSHLQSSLS
jgi:hypothetical protein